MASPEPDVRVVDDPTECRYELWVDDVIAGFSVYGLDDGTITLYHTEIDAAFEGRGLAAQLVSRALDDIRARGLHMIPLCPFVRSYIDRHREYADLVGRTE